MTLKKTDAIVLAVREAMNQFRRNIEVLKNADTQCKFMQ